MEIVGGVELGHVLGGGRPFAFIGGRPPRVLIAALWSAALTERALFAALDVRKTGQVIEHAPFTVFATSARDPLGGPAGVLVVAGLGLDKRERNDLRALTRIFERGNVSRLATLLERLKAEDPSARGEVTEMLALTNYNVSESARNLGVCRATMYKYVNRFGIRIRRVPAAMRADRGFNR
jgi:hypothetical protein